MKKYHLLKTISWRVVATLTTIIIAWMVTHRLDVGLIVGGFEAVAKMFLYYAHERAWLRWEEKFKNTKPTPDTVLAD